MILSDKSIREMCEGEHPLVIPYTPGCVQPASYDVTLGNEFYIRRETIRVESNILMAPNVFMLGCTLEKLHIPDNMCARFEGKSSLGRQGLMTHVTAGFIDPGFDGYLTLELYNVSQQDLSLYPGMPIGQIAFEWLDQPCEVSYGSGKHHYQYQVGAQPALNLKSVSQK